MQISERQKNILMAIIDEFMRSADEIGSVSLLKNHDLGVSSATIRSEMVKLMDEGYLDKSHVSSGRIPTDQAIRLYVREVMRDGRLPTVDEVEVRQGIFKMRFSQQQLIQEILNILVEKCGSAAFFLSDDDRRYYGVSSLMKYEEMQDIEVLRRVLDVLEDQNLLGQIFSKYDVQEGDVSLLIGSESGIKNLEDCSMAFTRINLWRGKVGHMGVIGTRRLDYRTVIPTLRLVRETVENSLKGWQ